MDKKEMLGREQAFWCELKENVSDVYDAIIESEYDDGSVRVYDIKQALMCAYELLYKNVIDTEVKLEELRGDNE